MKHWFTLASALLFFTAASPAPTRDIPSGDWHWNIDDAEAVYAATTNAADNLLAQFCYPESGSCIYAVTFGLRCTKGNQYPALVNTDAGSMSIELTCGDDTGEEHLMFASDFDQMDKLVRSGQRIGIVIPLEGDEFKAVRFSLDGAERALNLMRKAAEKLQAARDQAGGSRPAVERL